MNVWGLYQSRVDAMGGTIRDTALKREKRMIVNKLPNNLSYQHAVIHLGADSYNIESDAGIAKAIHQDVAVINSDNLNEKYIYSLPGDDIHCGSLVEWMDNKWIVTERDANTTVYTRAKMIQCNHLLRWVGNDKKIYEQWCIVEDGTKLKRRCMRNGLASRKRLAKRIPLIAGTP